MTAWDWLDKIDKNLFKLIHSDGAIPSLDGFFLLLRHEYTWIPLYAFIVYWLLRYHRRFAWQVLLLSVICFGITDFVTAQFLKPAFGRLRPCHEPDLAEIIRNIISCGGKYSLPSNHASNHFGLALLWFLSVRRISFRKWHWLFLWAFLIGYAQVYAGKHYPFDIVAGAVFGSVVAYLLYRISGRWLFYAETEK